MTGPSPSRCPSSFALPLHLLFAGRALPPSHLLHARTRSTLLLGLLPLVALGRILAQDVTPGLLLTSKLANGDGTWRSLQDSHPDPQLSDGPLVGDFNGDGLDDLLFFRFVDSEGLYLQSKLSDGDATWTHAEVLHGDGYSAGPLVGDVNGDGRDDLVFYRHMNDTQYGWGWRFRTKLANGDGTWSVGTQDFHTEAAPFTGPIAGDFNGDGRTDLLFHLFNADGLYIRAKLSNGNGTFAARQDLHGDGASDGPVVADINGDGHDDLVFYSYRNDPVLGWGWRFRTKLSNGDGTWSAGTQDFHTEATPFSGPRTGDFNGDGRTDLIFYRFSSDGLYLRTKISHGNGLFAARQDLHGDGSADGPLVGDANGDGLDDLVFYSYRSDPTHGPGWRFRTKHSRGNGTWSTGLQDFHAEDSPSSGPIAGDFNGDMRLDMLFHTRQTAPPPDQEPGLRGAMVRPEVTAQDLRDLAAIGATLIRWQLTVQLPPHKGIDRQQDTAPPREQLTWANYQSWLDSSISHMKKLLPLCETLGIRVVVDLHSPPGGRRLSDATHRLFSDATRESEFYQAWDIIVAELNGYPAVLAWDALNEPGTTTAQWRPVARRVARNIRAIDPHRWIVIESVWGHPETLTHFTPIRETGGLVYSVHVYNPPNYALQGLGQWKERQYPGRAALEDELSPVIQYQIDHGVNIYIGEFGAVRWAPGVDSYIRDAIDIFESHGWFWTFHAWRESDVWDVELGPDRANIFERSLGHPAAIALREGFTRYRQ